LRQQRNAFHFHHMDDREKYKAGYVAIVGEPNVGKSTLMNALLDQKLSIVASRPQTTRQRVALGDSIPEPVESALAQILGKKKTILVLNKVDTIHRDEVLPLIEAFSKRELFNDIVPVSALRRENLNELLRTILKDLPVHPPFYPPDIVSEQPERFFAAELVREKIFETFREEIPYSTAVEIIEFKEREQGKTYISADIIVERDSQKGILIGKRGAALKDIGMRARKDIEEFIGRAVYLELRVKVRERWREDEGWLRRLGYSPDA